MMATDQQAQSVRDVFSQNLRLIRTKRELSQEDLAHLTEMHRTEISALERGRREPRLRTLIKLSAANWKQSEPDHDRMRSASPLSRI